MDSPLTAEQEQVAAEVEALLEGDLLNDPLTDDSQWQCQRKKPKDAGSEEEVGHSRPGHVANLDITNTPHNELPIEPQLEAMDSPLTAEYEQAAADVEALLEGDLLNDAVTDDSQWQCQRKRRKKAASEQEMSRSRPGHVANLDITNTPHNELPIEPQATKGEEKTKQAYKKKQNWCKYCETMQTKLMRHMVTKHPETREVKCYLNITDNNLKTQSKKRKEACKLIINQSNNIFNEKVMANPSTGNLIPVKKPKKDFSYESHLVCSSCRGLMSKKYFSLHKDSCAKRKSLLGQKLEESPQKIVLGPPLDKKYDILKSTILDKMRSDNVSRAVMSDPLILEFGRRFLKSHMAGKQKHYVSNKLRTLGDLLLRMKAKFSNISCLEDIVDPSNFDNLCDIVREWSLFDESTGLCEKGSVCRRLCKSLKNVSDILWSQAIKSREKDALNMAEIKTKHKQFMALMSSDWHVELSSIADKSVKLVNVTKEEKMPLKEDLVTYFNEMSTKILETTTLLKKDENVNIYNSLVKLTLAFLIAFNSRRPSEVAYATLENYKSLEVRDSPNEATRIGVFKVFATKNGVKVPIILPQNVLTVMDLVFFYRKFFKVPGQYIFAKDNGNPYNGTSVLNNSKAVAVLQKPQHFSANGLRHYWATITQLDPTIKSHMPKFLGHSSATHERFYEMPLTKVHLDIIGPTILNHCNINQQSSKSSSPQATTSQKNSHERNYLIKKVPVLDKKINQPFPKTSSPQATTSQENLPERNYLIEKGPVLDKKCLQESSRRKSTRKRSRPILNQEEPDDKSSSSDLFSDTSEDPDFSTPPKKSKKDNPYESSSSESSEDSSFIDIQKRNRWITPEKKELLNYLPKTVLGLEPAPRGAIQKMWENSEIIKQRHSLQTTRIEVSKYFTKKKKIPTPLKVNISHTS